MNEAAQTLLTFEDFSSFARTGSDVKHHRCDVRKAVFTEKGTELHFDIAADRFLRNMVRAILRDERALAALSATKAKPGDDFDMSVGGFTGEQAGRPVRIKGTVKYFGEGWGYDEIAMIEFGDNNLLFLVPTYTQIRTLSPLRIEGLNPDDYDVFVVKSRVHFRRGFDETGYAKTIMVVDAPGDWFGTTRLDALDYQYAPIDKLYPFRASDSRN